MAKQTYKLSQTRWTRLRIFKNLLVVSFSFLLVFTAYDGLSMLQSTMNKEIGTISQGCIYLVFAIGCLFLPKYTIKRLGCKNTMLIGHLIYVPYVAANFYPHWALMMPSAVLIGLAAALVWGAQATYFNEASVLYCSISEDKALADPEMNDVNFSKGSKVLIVEEKICLGSSEKQDNCDILKTDELSSDDTSIRKGTDIKCSKADVKSDKILVNDINVSNDSNISTVDGQICLGASEKNGNYLKLKEDELNFNNTYLLKDSEMKILKEDTENDQGKIKIEPSFVTTERSGENEKINDVTNSLSSFDLNVSRETYANEGLLVENQNTNLILADLNNLGGADLSLKSCNGSYINKGLVVDEDDNTIKSNINPLVLTTDSLHNSEKACSELKHLNIQNSCSVDKAAFKLSTSDCPEEKVATKASKNRDAVAARFFGLHGMIYQSAQITSNLLSYFVLISKKGHEVNLNNATSNVTCGVYYGTYSSGAVEDALTAVDDSQRTFLTGICVAIAFTGIALVFFLLDPLDIDGEPEKLSLDVLMATYRQCKKKEQFSLLPFIFFLGVMQGFYTADYTQAFISCTLGISHVGLVTAFFGASGAISASLSGLAIKHVGRIPVFVVDQAVFLSTVAWFMVWRPDPSQPYFLYLGASLWGFVMGILWAQIPALCGILFKQDQEAAFAAFYAFDAIGWFVGFLVSDYLCVLTKLYFLISVSVVGFIGYLATEKLAAARTKH